MPWWTCEIVELMLDEPSILIRPWGLENNVKGFESYAADAEMPSFFAPLMWTYLCLCILGLIYSLFAHEKKIRIGKFNSTMPQLLIGLVGISFLVVVITAVIFAAIRTGDFYGTKLIGRTYIIVTPYFMESDVYANLTPGFWLASSVGPLLIILALLRNKILNIKPD